MLCTVLFCTVPNSAYSRTQALLATKSFAAVLVNITVEFNNFSILKFDMLYIHTVYNSTYMYVAQTK